MIKKYWKYADNPGILSVQKSGNPKLILMRSMAVSIEMSSCSFLAVDNEGHPFSPLFARSVMKPKIKGPKLKLTKLKNTITGSNLILSPKE